MTTDGGLISLQKISEAFSADASLFFHLYVQPFDGAPPPRIVDLVDTHAKFIDNLAPKKLSYVQQLELAAPGGRLPPNSKPSLLQTKLKGGSNRYY